MKLNRRDFIGGLAFAAASGITGNSAAMSSTERAMAAYAKAISPVVGGLLASEPVLQAPASDSMGVAFAVPPGVRAIGFAEVADNPEMKGAVRHFCEGFPQGRIGEIVMKIRMSGLKPATRYYYRVGASSYAKIPRSWQKPSEIVWGGIHSFVTPGAQAQSAFAVINDTHEKYSEFAAATNCVKRLGSPVLIWNGDCCGDQVEEVQQYIPIYYKPPEAEGYASDIPVLLTLGNHEYRGLAAHRLGEVMMTRSYLERMPSEQPLDRNFAIRQGDIALIGLMTGEDKPDRHPANCGCGRFEEYRSMQTRWLKRQFRRPEIASAPFVVAFCHIPIFSSNPKANPGTTMKGFAAWQGQCAAEWGPVLSANGVQLVVAGHTHGHRCDLPTEERTWAQIVGGGPRNPTVISGAVKDGRLEVDAYDVNSEKSRGHWSFARRSV